MTGNLSLRTLKEKYWVDGNIFLLSTNEYRMVWGNKLINAHGYVPKAHFSEDLRNMDSLCGEKVIKIWSSNGDAEYLVKLLEPNNDPPLWESDDTVITMEEIKEKMGIEKGKKVIILGY